MLSAFCIHERESGWETASAATLGVATRIPIATSSWRTTPIVRFMVHCCASTAPSIMQESMRDILLANSSIS